MTKQEEFWRTKTLSEMSRTEWESLCDGCGRCCLGKFTDDETGDIAHTNVACRLLDTEACRCSSYEDRHRFVPDCVRLTVDKVAKLGWLPRSCAYRRLSDGKSLAWWHPLVSGDPHTVHWAGISIRGRVVSERDVVDGDFSAYRVEWSK